MTTIAPARTVTPNATAEILPHDLEAEAATLGSMLLAPEVIEDVVAILPVDQKDWFLDHANQRLYPIIVAMHRQGTPIDLVLTVDELRRLKLLEEVGGEAYLVQLCESVPSGNNAAFYAKLVCDKALRRRIIMAADQIRAAARDDYRPASDILADATLALSGVADDEAAKTKIQVWTVADMLVAPTIKYSLPPFIPKNSFVVAYGPSGGGKSFVAQGMCMAVASGQHWVGRYPVEQGPTFYVVGEGQSGAPQRTRAWLQWHKLEPGTLSEFYVIPQAVDMMSPEWVDELSTVIETTTRGQPPAIVTLDTLARCLQGNENDAEDMSAFIAGCDRLRSRFDCSVVVLHHTGWNEQRERGSSSLKAAADMKFRVDATGDLVTLMCDKAKDSEEPGPVFMRRIVVQLEGGGTSCVMVPYDGPRDMLSEHEQAILEIADQHPEGLKRSLYQTELVPDVMSKASFDRAMRSLYQKRLIRKRGQKPNVVYVREGT